MPPETMCAFCALVTTVFMGCVTLSKVWADPLNVTRFWASAFCQTANFLNRPTISKPPREL